MASTLKKALAGSVGQASSSNNADAEHVAHRIISYSFTDFDAAADYVWCAHVAQADMTITAAYLVPSVTQGVQAANYVTLTLSKGDLAAGALTDFDAIDTATGGDNVALTAQTKRAFTIVESTDTLDAGDGLYLSLAHAATTTGEIAGILVVEYKLSN